MATGNSATEAPLLPVGSVEYPYCHYINGVYTDPTGNSGALAGARITKSLTTILRLSFDIAEVRIDFRHNRKIV